MKRSSDRSAVFQWGKEHWVAIRRVATAVFVLVIVALIVTAAASVEWPEVLAAVRELPGTVLWTAALLALGSYTACSAFDVLGKWYTAHGLPTWRAMLVGFVSYTFTMNFGAPFGGGLRLRLYAKQGLATGTTMRIMALSLTTNWIGYLFLAGAVFSAGSVRLPANWELGNGALRAIGVGMLVAGVAYLVLCAFSKKRAWIIRGHEIELPTIGLALVQVLLAMASWSLIAAVIYVLLQQQIAFFSVLGVLLISAIAGALAHIPGGLGVTESVFVALLSGTIPRPELLGSLLVYRAVYYLGPLLLASLAYLLAEAGIKKTNDAAGQADI